MQFVVLQTYRSILLYCSIAITSVFTIEHVAHIGEGTLYIWDMVALYMCYDTLSGCHPVIARQ